MKVVKFTGQYAMCFHDLGEIKPGDERRVTDAQAKNLIGRGEFELAKPAAKAPAKLETDKTASRDATSSKS